MQKIVPFEFARKRTRICKNHNKAPETARPLAFSSQMQQEIQPSSNRSDTGHNKSGGCDHWLWNGSDFEPAKGLPFSDRGLRYGMSIFETLRIRNGRPELWAAHLQRLRRASEVCGFPLPSNALDAAARIFPIQSREGVARLYVTAGDGAPADAATECRLALLFEERQRLLPASYRAVLHPQPHLAMFGGLKTANYWMNAEALRQARNNGADEALLFNPSGALIGACMANVFLKKDGKWLTPSLEYGARDGVVRSWALGRLSARATLLTRTDVLGSESVILTSSWLGLMPLHQMEDRMLDAMDSQVREFAAEWNVARH